MAWTELKKLEASCAVSMKSYLDESRTLRWIVLVQPKDTEIESFEADAQELGDAVVRVVEMARERKLL